MEMNAIFKKKLLLSLFFVILFFTFFIGFSAFAETNGTETWYTDFTLIGDDFLATDSTTGSFGFELTNHSLENISGNIVFVDAIQLMSGVYACKSDTETGVFGRYLHTANTVFSLSPEETITGEVTFNFPSHYSGTFHGCIVYSSSMGDTGLNMASRKALPLHITLKAEPVSIQIIANLGSRANSRTANNNGYESMGKLLFYSSNQNSHLNNQNNHLSPIVSGYVNLGHDGTGEMEGVTVLAGCYDVVYKGWHHLASYLENVCLNEGDALDFVTSLNLSGVGLFPENLPYNSGWAYQVAGDLPNSAGEYDFVINAVDLSVLYYTGLCPYLQTVPSYSICDLNNDGRVDSSDVSVIVANKDKTDAFYANSGVSALFEGFGTVNYFE